MHCKKKRKKRECASRAHSFCKSKRIKSRFGKIVSTQLETKLDKLETIPLKLKFLSQLTNLVGESADIITHRQLLISASRMCGRSTGIK